MSWKFNPFTGNLDFDATDHAAVTIGTANGLSLVGQALSLGLASSGVTGALSGTDWDTFNNKQAALTFPLGANFGGTGIANAAGSTLTLGAATTITGGGTVALGGFTLTVPATGTAALLATANVFTAVQQFQTTTSTGNIPLTLKSTDENNFPVGGRSLLRMLDQNNVDRFDFMLEGGGSSSLRNPSGVFTISGNSATYMRSGDPSLVRGIHVVGTGDQVKVGIHTASPAATFEIQTKISTITTLYAFGTLSPIEHIIASTTVTNAVKEITRLQAQVSTASTGGTTGFGPSLTWYGESATDGTYRQMGQIDYTWATATDASRKARGTFWAYDTAAREAIRIEASGTAAMLAFYGGGAVVRGAALTTQLTTITHTSPGTPDYAIQDLTNVAPFGFASQDEGNTVLSVIRNLQVRVAELEARLGSATGVNLFS